MTTIKTLLYTLLLLFFSFKANAQKKTGNKYLDSKERPSLKEQRENKKVIAKGNSVFFAQEEENKKQIRKNQNDFFNKKAQYKKTLKIRKKKKTGRAQF